MTREPLFIWTVYYHPRDYPDKVICRKWEWDSPTDEIIIGETVAEVTAKLPAGLVFLARAPDDDPCILGVWI